ncbi:MAG TPA: TIGR04290 family methyltransferase [Candidatus Binatia bacterium]|jgi:tRNA (mo5U34)-methyltransferase
MQQQTTISAIDEFKPWFHNLHLPNGAQTAPDHPLGDFPANKWRQLSPHIPSNLTGWSVIDIGCNAGFYSFELVRRGAIVTAIDVDNHYLQQARWAARQFGLEERITFKQMQVYELARLKETYDLVWFMGVFYHLRYPFLALNIVARKVKRLMVFQTLTIPGKLMNGASSDPSLEEREILLDEKWPKMAFIEGRLAQDPTNWWVPNASCVEALLRSSGLDVVANPAHEIYLCKPAVTDPFEVSADQSELSKVVEAEFEAAVGIYTGRNLD